MQIYIKYPQPPKKKLFGQKKEQNNVFFFKSNVSKKFIFQVKYFARYKTYETNASPPARGTDRKLASSVEQDTQDSKGSLSQIDS